MTEQALCNAMRLHGDTVYRLALCRMQNTADAEDVYQDVFLRLFQQAADWDGEHTKAWLIRATLNRCADLHRFRLRRPVLALEELSGCVPDTDGTERILDEMELTELLDRFLASLTPENRKYFMRRYWYFSSVSQIAADYGLTESKVKMSLLRSRNKLREMMEKEGVSL